MICEGLCFRFKPLTHLPVNPLTGFFILGMSTLTETEIVEGNKLIFKSQYTDHDYDAETPYGNHFFLKVMPYHDKIDMLMDVARNISRVDYTVNLHIGSFCAITDKQGYTLEDSLEWVGMPHICHEGDSDKLNMWRCFIDFLKYHKEHNPELY